MMVSLFQVIKDRVLFVMVVTILLVDTVLLALWTGLDLPTLAYLTKQVTPRTY